MIVGINVFISKKQKTHFGIFLTRDDTPVKIKRMLHRWNNFKTDFQHPKSTKNET